MMARTSVQVARICSLISIGASSLCGPEGYHDHSSTSHEVQKEVVATVFYAT